MSDGKKVTVTLTEREWRVAATACSDAARKVWGERYNTEAHRLAAEFYRAGDRPVLASEEWELMRLAEGGEE